MTEGSPRFRTNLYVPYRIQYADLVCRRKKKVVFFLYDTSMKTMANENIRELRRILGQTQDAFAATIGASKDTVASWETGRNRVSEWMARRIALATGVD